MYIYGIVAIEDRDSQGEVFDVAGIDISKLHDALIRRNLESEYALEHVIGMAHEAFVVANDHGTEHVDEWKVYEDAGKKPCVMVRATLFDDHAVNALRAGVPLYFAAVGIMLERDGEKLVKTRLTGLALTPRGVHPSYRVHFYQ